MPDSIDRLDIEISAKSRGAATALDNLSKKLVKLSESLSAVNGADFTNLTNGLKNISDVKFDANGLDGVVTALNKLGGVKATQATSNLRTVKDDLQNFISGINGLGALNFDAASLSALLDSISRLGSKASTSATQNLKTLSNDFKTFISDLNTIGSLTFDTTNLTQLVTAISKLGYKSVGNAVTNIPNLATALNGLFTTLSQSPQVSANILQITQNLADLASQGSRVGSASNTIVRGLNNVSGASTRATKNTFSLAAAFGKFYASYFLVIRGIKGIWKSIKSGFDYTETYNFLNVAVGKVGKQTALHMGEYGEDAAEYFADQFQYKLNDLNKKMTGFNVGDVGELFGTTDKNLGLDPNVVMNFQAKVTSVTNSVGLLGDTSINTSKALTMLSADISSLTNTNLEDVMTNLSSALIGQSRAVYKYGYDITNANLQNLAFELGIEKAVSAMDQSEKMQLRVISLLRQSRNAWGDEANTLNSLANMYRQFQQQVANLGRTLGNLFLPIVQKVLPFVNGLIIALQRLFEALGFKLYGDNWLKDIMDGISSAKFDGLEEDLEDIEDDLTGIGKAAKKATAGIRAFDELNVINTDKNVGKGSGAGGASFDLSDVIADELSKYEAVWNEAFANAENLAQTFADNIVSTLSPIFDWGGKLIGDIKAGDWEAVGKDISDAVAGVFNFGSALIDSVNWEEVGTNIGKFLDGLEWTSIIASAGNFFEKAFNAAFDLWKASFKEAPLETLTISVGTLFWKLGGFKSLSDSLSKRLSATFLGKSIGFIPTITVAAITWIIGFDAGKSLGKKLFPEDAAFYDEFTWFGDGGFFDSITEDWKLALDSWIDMMNDYENNPVIAQLARITAGPFATAVANIKAAYDELMEIDWEGIGQNIKNGLFGGISKFLESDSDVFKKLFDFVVKSICAVFGIAGPAKEMEPFGEYIFLGIVQGFEDTFDRFYEKVQEFFDNYVTPWFTLEKWEGILSSVPEAFKSAFMNAGNIAISFMNNVIGGVEKLVNNAIDGLNTLADYANSIPGVNISARISKVDLPKIPDIKGYYTGGYPDRASLFYAGEDGRAEMLGTIGGRTAVAGGDEITGIRDAVYKSSQEEISVLRQLLQVLIEKDFGITDDEIFESVQRSTEEFNKRTNGAYA